MTFFFDFQERNLPSGEDTVKGLSMTFPKASRHHSGHYFCAADNGFGAPTTAHITLDVQRKCSKLSKNMKTSLPSGYYGVANVYVDPLPAQQEVSITKRFN